MPASKKGAPNVTASARARDTVSAPSPTSALPDTSSPAPSLSALLQRKRRLVEGPIMPCQVPFSSS